MSLGKLGISRGGFGGLGSGGKPPSTAAPNATKYWFNGLPLERLGNKAAPTGGVKYWFNGQPIGFIA